MPIVAVVFDLDYTLAVPVRARETLLGEATEATGAPPITREAYLDAHRRSHTHETRAPIFADLLAGYDTDVAPEDLADAYRNAIAGAIEPVGGAEDLVSDLCREYRVGLLTNGPVVAQRDKIATLGWEELFDAVVVTGSLDAGKPDERAFASILDELDVAPAEAVYVGDAVATDVRGATNAGLHMVQVCYPGGPDPDARADAHVDRAELGVCLPDVIAGLDGAREVDG